MCVAMPGIVKKIDGSTAVVNFSGNEVNAHVGLVDVQVDDYVLVHAGCVIQKVKKTEAEEIIELMGGM
ncbi:HypC/HybG/HupF family hydrogenase formation chaperone [Eubacterium xylanophilum]|uniref:HypC/HybG/HupF family hydrogenase formation chaperone n=1 Tax=Eubacterium xylanophilum TaxID=39497 RepID=UPI000478E1A1|nr:HypC/HybG/HupF family hydrogenase formation chaperone [Eubacterium xylanophilum]MCR5797974.1 HypC/HybG/HupF family hydrogenase formation chaperone [Eubacterium sp.]